MATTITMPQLGETVTEGTVSLWLKKPGDAVEKYEPFVEIATDKVSAEVPAPVSGIIRELIAREGQTVPTGAPIAIIDEIAVARTPASAPSAATPESSAPPALPPPTASTSTFTEASMPPSTTSASSPMPPSPLSPTSSASSDGRQLQRGSPAVRRLAREHHVDLPALRGSGAGGRITAKDVLAAAARNGNTTGATPRSAYAAPALGEMIPLTQARRLIAERMVESKHTIPHAWTMMEADVTNVWKLRAREKDAFERAHEVKLTLLPFFIRAVAAALKRRPMMNARFTDEGIYVYPEINISLAVGMEGNLLLPVIRNADTLSIVELARACASLAGKARAGKLGADDLVGGTFTVNNTGSYGSILSVPIIPLKQTAVVTTEAVVKRLVVRDDDTIAIRSMMNVCLSIDHRVVDGSIACAFLADIKERLETIDPNGAP